MCNLQAWSSESQTLIVLYKIEVINRDDSMTELLNVCFLRFGAQVRFCFFVIVRHRGNEIQLAAKADKLNEINKSYTGRGNQQDTKVDLKEQSCAIY